MKNFIQPEKSKLKLIPISEFADFIRSDYQGSKTDFLTHSIEQWIIENFNKTIHQNDLMPPKKLMADLLDVSIGTIQNIYRNLEDKGLLYSKQCVGTLIADIQNKNQTVRKSSSKRDYAIELIKTFIKQNDLKENTILPSARAIAQYIDIPINTTRLALETMVIQGIIEKTNNKDLNWLLKKTDFEINQTQNQTLPDKIENDLKSYISNSLRLGDKMPTHNELAKMFKVSIKTIHNGLAKLIEEGILLPKRGRYGTCVVKIPDNTKLQPQIETSIFAKSQVTSNYHYERIQNAIKNLIIEKYAIHSKLPSIMELANFMDVSPNTIRKAFSNLALDGYLNFVRGRYGGTYVTAIPKSPSKQAFEWVAVNPKYADFQNDN